MERKVWIAIAVIAIAVAAFLGVRAYQLSQGPDDGDAASAEMKRQLDAATARALDAQRKLAQEEEARRLADLKTKQEAETEARRLAQTESERVAQEQARKRAEDEASKANSELDRMRGERAVLAAEAQRLTELRAREGADAQAKLSAAQRALEESERQKNAEIQRQAALIASYSKAPAPTEKAPLMHPNSNRGPRIIFPSDYKRANHYYLPLLPTPEKESK
jgi:hypothetical protein